MESILRIIENSLIAILVIVAIALAIYLLLMVLEWGLKLKSRGREQEGLTGLWTEAAIAQNAVERSRIGPSPKETEVLGTEPEGDGKKALAPHSDGRTPESESAEDDPKHG